ncbi:hypothetical protein WJX77_006949 [Trebouxia sp. C0004]
MLSKRSRSDLVMAETGKVMGAHEPQGWWASRASLGAVGLATDVGGRCAPKICYFAVLAVSDEQDVGSTNVLVDDSL